jgi:oxygen-independent coproporphyrinogen-3 oxidase
MTDLSGIYVHLPYCRSRCGYCAFVVTTDESSRERYFAALSAEADLAAVEAAGTRFDSIYLGGGTPSLSPPAELSRLLDLLRGRFAVDAAAEVTLEANPDDVTPELARSWKEAGVNRVSLGIQSFDDRELAAVGRRHDAATASRALGALSREGFSISGDLILGLPEQTAGTFRASAETLAGEGVDHVSVYLLEVEKSRSLEEDRRARPRRYLSDDAQADAWLELGQMLESRGLEHYEISNWARPGRRARHNLKYWQRAPTLGLGVAAHELWGGHRRANVATIPGYVDAVDAGRRSTALDAVVSSEQRARERIYLGLRLAEGIAESELAAWIALRRDRRLEEDFVSWLDAGWLVRRGDRVRFSEPGFLLSNEVLCRFA